MRIDRRNFLRLVTSPLLVPALPVPAGADAPTDAVFIIIEGIGATTPVDLLQRWVAPFLAAKIPLAVIPNLESDPAAALIEELRQIFATSPDLTEPVLSLPGLSELPHYFQRRTASDALQRMRGLLENAAGAPPSLPVTIATNAPLLSNFDALRCLGIRNVLTLSAAQSVSSAGCAERVVCLRGGQRMVVADVANPTPWIEGTFAAPGWRQIVFSLAGIENLPAPDVRLRAQRAADAIGRMLNSGRHFAALPRDHALWFGDDQMRFVAVRIAPGTAATAAAMTTIKDTLLALGITVTDTAPPDIATATDLVLLPGAGHAFDDRGRFIRGETALSHAADLTRHPNLMRDAIITIKPQDYATVAARKATLDTLRAVQQLPGTRFVDMPAFVAATVTPDPVFDLLRETRRDSKDASEDPEALTHDELLADARHAWTYFDRFTVAATGLCVDTVDVQVGYTWLHRELTMWDFGSLISAVMAAHELGLIPDTEFIARSALLVGALPVARIGGLMLPSEVISADTTAALSSDFNACDTGRLLNVLRAFDAHPLIRGIAADKIARWDLDGVVVDGHVHSVVKGRLVDRFRSQCAHYTALAFRSRGIEAASPYEVADADSKTDREMQLLQSLIGLDPLGAEPLLLEALEIGLSEPSAMLADVLFGAQRREYESTGALTSMSEAPINREPWFTYQGLNIASSEERWVVNATSANPRFATPAFRREIRLVNTKAAYLWAATRPSAYSTLLARHVRDRARLDGIGFSPGVFVATGQAMPGYSDVNTNGIVLEAIAYLLRGRMPRKDLVPLRQP
ncbi:DUF3131 domain-containing protein [Yoonia sp.]|uniref:DUF3131 domain-containing protein n=1 Tax=Yoonia sp. TaxID=2212373 RepID=UPI0019F71288|nr:DUF3131 domain-containing protein [Yoonia sp.]MBE0412777.1 DUF3131 domain-containing protein [Yoonia sp.]